MRANSPPGAVFAFDVAALKGEGVTFWTAWRDGAAVGMAALKRLDAADAELKSMRTHPAHLRQGIAGALLAHVVAAARARGHRRLLLETGTGPAFEPAAALYRARGFAPTGPFGDYLDNGFSRFMVMDLASGLASDPARGSAPGR
ncbi:MAG: GNAT family N-acetyltransferase [Hyphomicrobiales bacterium]|nr:GNAT family N-acetyltransferase [Hyphomicrobiales bacterium]